jgi:hypothetical protein
MPLVWGKTLSRALPFCRGGAVRRMCSLHLVPAPSTNFLVAGKTVKPYGSSYNLLIIFDSRRINIKYIP